MAIFRCTHCHYIRELPSAYIGKSAKCPQCSKPAKVQDTVKFLTLLLKKHLAQGKELQVLRARVQDKQEPGVAPTPRNDTFKKLDIHNTDYLTQADNLKPLIQWFKQHNINAEIPPEAIDTTGFFDEVALLMGDDFELLNIVTKQIKYVQNKGYTNVKVDLHKYSAKEIERITAFCQQLYDYSFVARYTYQKKQQIIRLTLQQAPKIREFFNGIWMEWFVLMKALKLFREQKIAPACGRNVQIGFAGGERNELDLFFLTETNTPVCIECKSGEFRHDIDKYLALRKQLGLHKTQFVLCVFGLSSEQAQGMTSMYDISFVNETTLVPYLKTLV